MTQSDLTPEVPAPGEIVVAQRPWLGRVGLASHVVGVGGRGHINLQCLDEMIPTDIVGFDIEESSQFLGADRGDGGG